MQNPRITAARKAVQDKAAALGITPAYISKLVDLFYDRIRSNIILGPIFETAIGDHWDPHLKQMKAFWASVTMNAGLYSGKPVQQHRKHSEIIAREHFDIWLALFRETLEDTAPSPECVEYFMQRADRIANSLKLALFGTSGLGPPKYG